MPSHARREEDLVATAERNVKESEAALANARASTAAGHAPGLGALADVEDAEWVRLKLNERRRAEAIAAQAVGQRRRERFARFRRAVGLPPREPDEAPPSGAGPTPPNVHEATGAFLDQRGAHREDEDLHPHRLDEAETDLSDALDRQEIASRAERRDARDGI